MRAAPALCAPLCRRRFTRRPPARVFSPSLSPWTGPLVSPCVVCCPRPPARCRRCPEPLGGGSCRWETRTGVPFAALGVAPAWHDPSASETPVGSKCRACPSRSLSVSYAPRGHALAAAATLASEPTVVVVEPSRSARARHAFSLARVRRDPRSASPPPPVCLCLRRTWVEQRGEPCERHGRGMSQSCKGECGRSNRVRIRGARLQARAYAA